MKTNFYLKAHAKNIWNKKEKVKLSFIGWGDKF
jgi:hypothetical protein